jgi:hypothetical protein
MMVPQGGVASSSNVRYVRLFNNSTKDYAYFIIEIAMYCVAFALFCFELHKFRSFRSRHYRKFRSWIAVVNFLSVAISAFFSWRAWSGAAEFAGVVGDISKAAVFNLQGLAFDRMLVQCAPSQHHQSLNHFLVLVCSLAPAAPCHLQCLTLSI